MLRRIDWTADRQAGSAALLGLRFDRVDMTAAVDRCLEWCRGPRASHIVITANASHLCAMRHDREFHAACRRGDLIVADGMSVVWALKAAGVSMPGRIAGVDLLARLLAEAAAHRLRVYFFGARQEVVTRLVAACATNYPGLTVAGYRNGYFEADEETAIAEAIATRAPDVLFVGMPSPFKEQWCERNRERLNVPVIVGVGGSFDVLAGFIQRAPSWMQRAGLEWLWRLAMEPRRLWKRYLSTNCEFLWLAAREVAARRLDRLIARQTP